MERYDREELLGSVDLPALFAELVGPVRKEGAGWKAPCPDPAHGPQTGKTPPVSIDEAGRLWHCFACQARGSAVDLVMLHEGVGTGPAFDFLARRAGLRPSTGSERPRSPAVRQRPEPALVPLRAREELEGWVASCEAALWAPEGVEVLAWLRQRCIADEVLRANRVGADVGRSRPEGLPKPALGAVFPVLAPDRSAVYVQHRPLKPAPAKWLNPDAKTFGPCPRVVPVATPSSDAGGTVLVCEGIPDALAAASTGYRATALLGTAMPDAAAADHVVAHHPDGALVLALDGDQAGAGAARTFSGLLADAGAGRRVWQLEIPEWISPVPKERDVNRWAVAAGADFAGQLADAVTAASPVGWSPALSAADLVPALLAELEDRAGALAIPTGLAELDRLLADGGWRPGLVLLGGLPGIGKSALALQATLWAAAAGHPVLYVSVEQSEKELLGRLFCRELELPIAAYWNRAPGFAAGAARVAARLPLERLYIRTDPYTAGEDHVGTVGRVRQWTAEILEDTGQRPLVVVDYLQRVRPAEGDRRLDERLRISQAGLGLRQLARDMEVPVLVVSSIGRGSYEGTPNLAWFKGSGDLEYDADACIILRPDGDQMPDTLNARVDVELHVVKNRYGRLTNDTPLELIFDRRFGTFQAAPYGRTGADDPQGPPRPPLPSSLRLVPEDL